MGLSTTLVEDTYFCPQPLFTVTYDSTTSNPLMEPSSMAVACRIATCRGHLPILPEVCVVVHATLAWSRIAAQSEGS